MFVILVAQRATRETFQAVFYVHQASTSRLPAARRAVCALTILIARSGARNANAMLASVGRLQRVRLARPARMSPATVARTARRGRTQVLLERRHATAAVQATTQPQPEPQISVPVYLVRPESILMPMLRPCA